MSAFRALIWAREVTAGRGPDKLVLLILATHCDDFCVASVGLRSVLVPETELAERTIRMAVRRLAQQHLLVDIPMEYEDGSPAESDYVLNVDGWLDDVVHHGLAAVVGRLQTVRRSIYDKPLNRRMVAYSRKAHTEA